MGTRVSRPIAQIPPVGQRERPLLSPPLGPAISGVYLLGAAHFKGWKTILSQELINGLREGLYVGIDGPGEGALHWAEGVAGAVGLEADLPRATLCLGSLAQT